MPRKKFFSLAEAVAMICEEDTVSEVDLVVLPPAHVDDQSVSERCDEDDLVATDWIPTDVAGEVKVHYQANDKNTPSESCSIKNNMMRKLDEGKSFGLRKKNTQSKGNGIPWYSAV